MTSTTSPALPTCLTSWKGIGYDAGWSGGARHAGGGGAASASCPCACRSSSRAPASPRAGGSEDLMTAGRVTVNGAVATELGHEGRPAASTSWRVDGRRVDPSQGSAYLVLNKPKDTITTMDDPQGRPTVVSYVPTERFPGRVPSGAGWDPRHHGRASVHHRRRPRRAPAASQLAGREDLPRRGGTARGARGGARRDTKRHRARRRPLRAGACGAPWTATAWPPGCAAAWASGPRPWRSPSPRGAKREVKRMLSAIGHPVIELERVSFGPRHGAGAAHRLVAAAHRRGGRGAAPPHARRRGENLAQPGLGCLAASHVLACARGARARPSHR